MRRYLVYLGVLFVPLIVNSTTIEYMEYYNAKNQFVLFEAKKIQTNSSGLDNEMVVSFDGAELNIRIEVKKENYKLYFYSTVYFDSSKANSFDSKNHFLNYFNQRIIKNIGIADREENIYIFKRLFPGFEAENYVFNRFEKVYYDNDRPMRREYFHNEKKTRTDYYTYTGNIIKLTTVNETSLDIEKAETFKIENDNIKITKSYFTNGNSFFTSMENWKLDNDVITRIGSEGDSILFKKFSGISKQAFESQITENFFKSSENLHCFKINSSLEMNYTYYKNQNIELNLDKQVIMNKSLYYLRDKNKIIGQLTSYNYMVGNEYAEGNILFTRKNE